MNGCEITKNTIKFDNGLYYSTDISLKFDEFLFKAYNDLKIEYPKFHKMDLICKLGILTSSILFRSNNAKYEPLTTGIIISSSSGSYNTDKNYIDAILSNPESTFPALFTYTLPSIVMGEICIKHKIHGENIYLITDDFNEDITNKLINYMFKEKGMNHCVVGWIEVKSTNNYFSNLKLISNDL